MHFLITGGCGFIGTNFIKLLLKNGGHRIRVIDNLTVGSPGDLKQICNVDEVSDLENLATPTQEAVQLVVGNIMDKEVLGYAASGMDVMVHLAANTGVQPSVENPEQDCMTNVLGTLFCLEAARKHNFKRFVFSSSGAPVGECEPPIHEEKVPHPISPYGASKLSGEGYCSAFFHSFKLETVVLRFSNVYGPGSVHKASVIAKFINRALAGETLEIFGDGTQTRDFIYVEDLVKAIYLASTQNNIGGEIFQIATSRETSISEIVKLLQSLLRNREERDLQIENTTVRTGDVRRNFSDASKARNVLGWEAETSLDKGLRNTFDYFKSITNG